MCDLKTLETKDLILKKPQYDDWKDMYINLWSQDESAKYMMWRPIHSEEEAMERMRKNIRFIEDGELKWFVYEKKSGQAIGFAGMEKVYEGTYKENGIAIGPAFTKKGYGKQIIGALVNEAFNHLGACIFIASCRRQNLASKGMLVSYGFEYKSSQDKMDLRTGEPYVLDYYEYLSK